MSPTQREEEEGKGAAGQGGQGEPPSPSYSYRDAAPPADPTPGWKPDPLNPEKQRKWDGQKWLGITKGGSSLDSVPNWAWIAGVVAALVVGLVAGAAIGSEEDKLKDEVAEAEAKVADAEEQQEDAEEEAASVMERKRQIIGHAKSQANQIVGKAKSELSTVSGKLDKQRGELEATEGQLSEIRSELFGAEEEAELSVIHGDGTYKIGTDIIPGTYRSSGGSGCYWAILNSTDSNDIATNELGNGPQIAEIEGAYFQTKGCGEWERVE